VWIFGEKKRPSTGFAIEAGEKDICKKETADNSSIQWKFQKEFNSARRGAGKRTSCPGKEGGNGAIRKGLDSPPRRKEDAGFLKGKKSGEKRTRPLN